MIELLQQGGRHGWEKLKQAVEQALNIGCTTDPREGSGLDEPRRHSQPDAAQADSSLPFWVPHRSQPNDVPRGRILNQDQLLRVATIVAIDDSLHKLLPRRRADKWISRWAETASESGLDHRGPEVLVRPAFPFLGQRLLDR